VSAQGFRYEAVSSGLFFDLYKLTGETALVEWEPEVEQFGVWLGDDLIAAGDSETEALEEAITTAQVWKQNEGRPAGRSYE
jgi:hypothetical protein